MSQFYSDLITWSVVGLASGALVLGSLTSDPAPRVVPIAATKSADSAPTTPVVLASSSPIAVSDTAQQVVEVAELTAVPQVSAGLPQIIEDAVLLDVSVDPNGDLAGLADVALAETGVVTGRSVNLRAGPGTGYQIVSRASQDERLVVTGQRDGIWVQVLAPISEQEAWIHGNYFDAPDPA